MASRKPPAASALVERGTTLTIPLEHLKLDEENPRFGGAAGGFDNQTQVLDWIVSNFGVEDVISSLAINGYFEAEPLVVEDMGDGNFIVREGNRRLAACLILAGDPRAKNQAKRRDSVAKHIKPGSVWNKNTKIPAISFDQRDSRSLTAYLGVRHIVSSQPWDSFAKAAWISRVVDSHDLPLADIAALTGDKSQTIAKLLEGYNFIRQLQEKSLFDPASSLKRGRGSNVDFPFSWVYTLLQYSSIRNWLGLEGYGESKNPIPKQREKDAALAMTFMFGDRNAEQQPRVADSRELGKLAYAITIPESRELLRQGHTVSDVEELSRPAIERLTSVFLSARENLRTGNGLMAEKAISLDEAAQLLDIVRDIRKSSSSALKQIKSVLDEEDDDD
ncbi:hypothetical protein HZS47_26615 [Achromobacter xylosoxidans]|uniref:hypothetical protein n=1 Tax=Alcaligenes xylosoxydans xylosoxydans TaxID=85698 RepID=UPI0015CD5350|nr:hypothetical protein [Achromobacter xylosoxidans]NYS16422.1 hypothetical protein [Achromobacter xylosoxidans]